MTANSRLIRDGDSRRGPFACTPMNPNGTSGRASAGEAATSVASTATTGSSRNRRTRRATLPDAFRRAVEIRQRPVTWSAGLVAGGDVSEIQCFVERGLIDAVLERDLAQGPA